METTVSNEFKAMCKSNTPSGAIGRIKVIEDDIEIKESTDIQNIEIEDNCYVNDKFIGTTVAKKVTVNLFNDDNVYDLEDKEIEVKSGFELNGNEELVSHGNFIIEKPNTEEVQAKTNFTGYDYMIKFNVLFVDNNTYPVELGTYFSNLCTQVGLVAGNTDFINSDYLVKGNPFTNNEDCRTVLSAIAQIAGGIAKIGRDNKVYIINLSKEDALHEIDGNNYDTFTSNKVFGPVNKVILKMNSEVNGEESVRSDEESISQNGECAITISDNPILTSQEERELVIDNIFNAIKGITYLPFKTTYYGYPYADSTDKAKISNVNDTEYNSYIFNHTISYDGSFSGSIETSALTKTQSMYKNTLDLKSRFRRTELAVDKINGKITAVIEEQSEQGEKLTKTEQDVNGLTTKVSSLEKTTVNKVQVQYALGDTLTTPPTAGWSETAPEWQAGKYMWQKTVTTYSDGATKESKATCIQGAKGETGASGTDGKDGTNGKDGKDGVDGKDYWRTTAVVDLSDNSAYSEDTWYPVTGSQLPSDGLARIKVYVQLNSGTKPSWSTHNNGFSVDLDLETQRKGWGTTKGLTLIYADNYNFCSVSPVSYQQMSYSSTPVLFMRGGGKYKVSTTYACVWTPHADTYTWTSGQYSQSVSPQTSRPTLEGQSIQGKTGKGIKSIQDQYYLSTSNTTQTGGTWKNTQDAWESGKYIWTRSHITWSDDTTTDTTPILAESLNTANENAVLAQEKTAEQKIEIDSIKQTVSQTQTTVANNYTEIKQKFGDYAPKSDVITLQNSVERIQTDTYTKTEINTKLTDGSVTKVTTTCGTFDENGLTIEKTNAKTKGNFNEKGMKVVDATGSSEEILLFAGYDEETDETIVKSKNMTVEKYLTIGANCRFEDYVNPILGGKGTGAFTL